MAREEQILFSGHALRRMFERGIERWDVIDVLIHGERISDYPEDRPYPSFLVLGYVKGAPLHVVAARGDSHCFVVTAYRPDPRLWAPDFKSRSQP